MKKRSMLLFIGIALSFFWASWQVRVEMAGVFEKTNRGTALSATDAPPLVVLTTVALGGFRGLLVDILWMRMINLQKEGKVFEIVQLADWITRLEPQLASVWAFHAWNMAYNISILYSNPEYRWLWIRNGIQLLRDGALKYNPDDPMLCRELGWIYEHKIGQAMDDMHLYYKQKLAQDMDDFSPGPQTDHAKADARLRSMRENYKLLPEIMRPIENYYGNLDWRLPESHSLYWAYRGRHSGGNDKETIRCEHMISRSMAVAFRQGRLLFKPQDGIYITTPRLDLLPGALKAYDDAINRDGTEMFKMAYVNFISEAVFILHAYGDDQGALKLFEKMLSMAPELRARTSYEKYLHQCDQRNITDLPMADAVARIEGLLYQSHAAASGQSITMKDNLREKATGYWEQFNGSIHDRTRAESFPAFALIDEQARQRALNVQKIILHPSQ